jgi:hypothetical protein
MQPLRTPEPEALFGLKNRAGEFLRYVADHRDNPLTTIWGDYGRFDVYGLALLELGDNEDEAHRLLSETLDMIDRNFADERANPNNKWHLADFAMHPLLRAYFRYRTTHFPDDPVWERIATTARQFLFHYGDLSENHNFLHLTLRFLVGQTWPDAVLADGRRGSEHQAEAMPEIRGWMRDWVTRGSAEWGADIYYNVNLLSLLNLYDFTHDPRLRSAAQGVLDLLALDEAVDAFAGSSVGAARRSYSVYRMDIRQSPARPLHYLWFNPPGVTEPFNLHFIGGVIEAATSDYLPPDPIVWIAGNRDPAENRATHLAGVWEGSTIDHLSKHTLRLPHVMQSVMNSPGGGGRYTEHVWQVTMGEEALVFSNHPTLVTARHLDQNTLPLAEILALYAGPRPSEPPPGQAWYWTYANVPPGHAGDVRPGYWQGSTVGPRSFGTDSLAFLVYSIPEDDLLPWAHVYLPRRAFDEVQEDENWIFLRKGEGYAALWMPGGYAPTAGGFWAGTELKFTGARSALLSFIGDARRDGGFADFTHRARSLQPEWDPQTRTLSALPTDGGPRLHVSYEDGPSQGGAPIDTRGERFETPWGTMALGSSVLRLETPAGSYDLDLSDAWGDAA